MGAAVQGFQTHSIRGFTSKLRSFWRTKTETRSIEISHFFKSGNIFFVEVLLPTHCYCHLYVVVVVVDDDDDDDDTNTSFYDMRDWNTF
jgi:hypothetical protein